LPIAVRTSGQGKDRFRFTKNKGHKVNILLGVLNGGMH